VHLHDLAGPGFLDEGLVVEHVGGEEDCLAGDLSWRVRVCLYRRSLYFGRTKILAWERKSLFS